MDALRRSFKELKPILEKVSFLKSMLVHAKNIFAVGCFMWILGGLIPDTAHFAVTFFSSIGRAAVLLGLFLAFVKGEDRSIMIMSSIIAVGSFIIIIIELAATSYLASFESYLFLILFGALAVKTSKYLKNNQWYEGPKKDDTINGFSDILSHTSSESESPVHIETLSPAPKTPSSTIASSVQRETPTQKTSPVTPETPVQPTASSAQSETPTQKTSNVPSEISSTPTKATVQRVITVVPTQAINPNLSKIHRAPSIGSVPTIGRAPSVRIEPKE